MVDEAAILEEMRRKAEAELGYPIDPAEWKTGSVIRPGDNPYEVMGLPDAKVRGYKLHLLLAIKESIREQGLTQTRVANLTGLSQPDVSKLMRGQFRGFSVERLIDVFTTLGGELDMTARVPRHKIAKGAPVPTGRVSVVAI